MQRFDSLLDAVASLYRRGYRWDCSGDASHHFRRGSWIACVDIQKNGRVRVECF